MKRVKINTPYDPAIQVPKALDKELKQQELDSLLNNCDAVVREYLTKGENSVAKKDKQLVHGNLVLFDHDYEIVVYRYAGGTKEWVAQYDRSF